ncbi:ATP-binding protein [Marinospirillum alkaliphilum]|uniref:histidine kinase n=1 Tax=Marinospirillum alkaliphilum DSM 21637 TaxID=1122209 RepID=A0A1K1WJS7_9GAMM|nr:ATP-binding protein [Marinospirillum alkaliphilum]SFX37037.1 PAS domain S-box-containing protein [Marinospirillum alkaliphilum DSM 21637]
MSFTLTQIFVLGVGYLSILFACAWIVERGWLPQRLVRHPLVYVLALGMYASAWAFYGSFGMAERYGYGYLTYYLGISAAFVLTPVLLTPLLRLTRTYQLSSLADLFAFRFRSRWVGMLVTLGLLAGTMPLLALQIQAIGDVIHLLTNESSPYHLAFVFCAVISLFATLFGARHISLRERHESLLVAIAFESLVKLVAFLALGAVTLWLVFDGFDGLENWLITHGDSLAAAVQPLEDNQWRTLLLLFFATAVSMPHIFHIIFTENPSETALRQASWMLPIFLLLLALPVPVIYWGHQALGSSLPIEYASLSLGGYWTLLSFIAGLAAASGTIIVITLALAPMVLNHLVLAVYQPPAHFDIYYWLIWMRRLLIASLIFIGYLVYLVVSAHHDLATLGLSAFIATLQFLPGILALLYWPTANRKGLLAGLTAGFGVWAIGLGFPLMLDIHQLALPGGGLLELRGIDDWFQVTILAITSNILIFIVISLVTDASEEEKAGALACSQDALLQPKRLQLKARTCEDFTRFLSIPLGQETAQREVTRALNELGLHPADARPYSMRRLRDQIQANLSGLMGPAVAQELTDRYLPWKTKSADSEDDIHYVERHLEEYRTRLTGMARELDKLRRHHRQTLLHLPVGICTLGRDQEVLMWNRAMEKLTGISGDQVIGSRIRHLPEPWNNLLDEFLQNPNRQAYRQPLEQQNKTRWLTLHKARLDDPVAVMGGTVLLVEDQSEVKELEDKLLHNERLASIGRLAAGVAHEIGNPVTGISSLAQNLRYDAEEPDAVRETSTQILQLTNRITAIVHSLVSFAHAGRHSDSLRFEQVKLHDAFQEAINLISLSNRGRNRQYTNNCPEQLVMQGDGQRLIQVFVNLIGNARDATQDGGQILCCGYQENHHLVLEVHDDGCGIPAEHLQHLFEPFYTTKQAGEGTGLGLALVYSIVEEHHGQIQAISPSPISGKGSCFRCRFPITANAPEYQEQ